MQSAFHVSEGVAFPLHPSPFMDDIMPSRLHRHSLSFGLATNVFVITACALHSVDLQAPGVARVPSEAGAQAPTGNVSYIAETPSFALVASTETARVQALLSLQSTASAFAWLFGRQPPQIGVVVLDTSIIVRVDSLVMPPAELTTFMITGGGLSGDDALRSAINLRRELRFTAARTWVSEYALLWNAMLDAQGVHFVKPGGGPIPYARVLPDWLHVGVLRVLTDEDGPSREMPESGSASVPVRTLFAYRLSSSDAAPVELELQGFRNSARAPVRDSYADMYRLKQFVWQSTSVLRYLRASQGNEAVENMFGALVGGLDMDDVLAHLPHPTTCEALDRAWHAWVIEAGDVNLIPSPATDP